VQITWRRGRQFTARQDEGRVDEMRPPRIDDDLPPSLGHELGIEISSRICHPSYLYDPRTIKTRCRGYGVTMLKKRSPYLHPTGVLSHYYRVVWADHNNIISATRSEHPLVLHEILAVKGLILPPHVGHQARYHKHMWPLGVKGSSFRLLRGRISGGDVWTNGFDFIIESR
jgi:hypothetical protein